MASQYEIMKQSKPVSLLKKLPRRKERRNFFRLYHAKLSDWFTCTCYGCVQTGRVVQIEIGCHVNGVEWLSQLFECCIYHSVRNL